jgi:3-hydroxybutyryl-CoA dehydrogenase
MQLLLINDEQELTWLWGKSFPFTNCAAVIAKEPSAALLQSTTFCIDLSFEQHPQRIELYKTIGKPVFIASTIITLQELNITHQPIARFNYWPSLQQRTKLELSITETSIDSFDSLLAKWEIDYQTTADVPGFVSARIISMIINEAYLALGEDVSSINEIDTAMRLGTNYPNGPFEWCDAIGIKNVFALLQKLSIQQTKYSPAPLLKQKANEQ